MGYANPLGSNLQTEKLTCGLSPPDVIGGRSCLGESDRPLLHLHLPLR
jgi:hypothetical protein